MAKKDFNKHMTNEVVRKTARGNQIMSTRKAPAFGGGDFSVDCDIITAPRVEISEPHRHPFSQYLCFFSSNPDDETDFDAEIELTWDNEKQIIKKPTAVWVPTGTYHGPLFFKTINKPVLFIDCAMTSDYRRMEETPKK